jgi:high-affinity K+ transport system ATPase subunit B
MIITADEIPEKLIDVVSVGKKFVITDITSEGDSIKIVFRQVELSAE